MEFSLIINMFVMEGMVALGKLKHPATNTIEQNLEHAKFIIDLLGVLQAKTKGNLEGAEASLLEQSLSTLRLNYVHESSSTEAKVETPQIDEKA